MRQTAIPSALTATVPVTTIVLVLLAAHSRVAEGHGRLIDPPARGSMWRYGYDTPINNDDHSLYCGGYSVQWETNGGRCGVCGDRYDGPRLHEAGGKYANGIIVRHFREGETITVHVELTRSHLGYFEFRLCPHNDPSTSVSQDCLDRYLLPQPGGSTRFPITSPLQGVRTIRLVLPPGVTCTQCVLQWKYNAGNSWGCEGFGTTQRCCLGCGRQEQYYGCADVGVTSALGTGNITHAVVNPTVDSTSLPLTSSVRDHTIPHTSLATASGYYGLCRGLAESMTDVCRTNCLAGSCSRMFCTEDCQWLAFMQDKPEGGELESFETS